MVWFRVFGRATELREIRALLRTSPVVAILGPAPDRQDDARPRDRPHLAGLHHDLRPGRSARRRAPRRSHDGARAASRPGRHRRDPTPAGAVPGAACPLGSRPTAGPLPPPRERVTLAPQAVVRVAGRAHRVRRAAGIRPLRCRGALGAALAAGRIPPALPRPNRRGEPALAPRPDPHVRGAEISRSSASRSPPGRSTGSG